MRRIVLPDIHKFEWDSGNVLKNKIKHNVGQDECEDVFENKPYISFEDPMHSAREQRYQIMGVTKIGRHLTLAITIRGSRFRVIMARDQSKKERIFFKKHRYL